MQIINHRLYQDDGSPYPFRDTPNRGGQMQPRYLVMHYTAGPSAEHSVNWLANPSAKASAHIVVGRDGSVIQMVPFNTVAWHAGTSHWNGINGLNAHSIGIELDNAGPLMRSDDKWLAWFGTEYPQDQVMEAVHKNQTVSRGWHLYTPEQLYTALDLAAVLVRQYGLQDVLGHEDIAPQRKTDPGPAFPMESFRSLLFGRKDDTAAEPEYETTSILNIRTGPGSQYQTLAQGPLPRGAHLQVLDQSGEWRQVAVLTPVNGVSDLSGWVHSRYIQPRA